MKSGVRKKVRGNKIDLGNCCSSFDDDVVGELGKIAEIYLSAGNIIISLASMAGKKADNMLTRLPNNVQRQISEVAEMALREAYKFAVLTQGKSDSGTMAGMALGWAKGPKWHAVATSLTGLLGGAIGLPGILIELPVTTTIILRSIQEVAAEYGEDLRDPAVQAQCVAAFGLGGLLDDDDDDDIVFFASRAMLTGKIATKVIRAVLPRFSIIVTEKVMTQATPVVGGIVGASINPFFANYFRAMAQVHFRLRKLERQANSDQLRACFLRLVAQRRQSL